MFDGFVQLIQQALRPYDDKFAELSTRIEELERRLRNTIQPGKVVEVDANQGRVKVAFGDGLTTPFIRWFAPSAGKINEYRCPSVNEQCALINYGGGDSSSQSWALCGIWSDTFAAPINPSDNDNANLHIIDWGEGIRLEINRTKKTVHWDVPEGVTFNTPFLKSTGDVNSDKNVTAKENVIAGKNVEDFVRTMQDDRDIFNVHKNGPKTTPPSPSK